MNIPNPLKTELTVQGFKYLELPGTLLTDLHEAGPSATGQKTSSSFTTSSPLVPLVLLHPDPQQPARTATLNRLEQSRHLPFRSYAEPIYSFLG